MTPPHDGNDSVDPVTGYHLTEHDWGGIRELNTPMSRIAVWALIIAILGLLTGLTVLGATISFLVGLVALVLAVIAIRRAGKIPSHQPGRRLGMSWTALILSLFAILMSVFFYLALFWLQQAGGVQDCLHLPSYEQRQTCLEEELTNGR